MATILRPALDAITLADGLRTRETYLNGCNFKIMSEGKVKRIGAGCYLLTGFIQGAEFYLWDWIKKNSGKDGFAKLPDEPEVHEALAVIMSQRPCKCCGGDIFYKLSAPPITTKDNQ